MNYHPNNQDIYEYFKKFLTPDILLNFNTGEAIWQFFLSKLNERDENLIRKLESWKEKLPNTIEGEDEFYRSGCNDMLDDIITLIRNK